MKIGNVEIGGRLALAPMAGVTDAAFRLSCRGKGAALTYTEMVSSRGLVYHDAKTKALLFIPELDHPCAAQIFGSDPDVMGEAAALARESSGADIIDLNMGCPVGKVVRSGDGAALMRDPEKAARIIEACVREAGCPITVKFRKGWDGGSVNAVEFAKMCEAAGAAAVAVHGRTRAQMYGGVADWEILRDVKAAVKIPILGNGDVVSAGDAVRMIRRTGVDMVMIGRGSFGDPWIFERANAAVRGEPEPPAPTLAQRIDEAETRFGATCAWKDEHTVCLEARKQFAWCLRSVANAGPFKKEINQINTLSELNRIAERIKRELR